MSRLGAQIVSVLLGLCAGLAAGSVLESCGSDVASFVAKAETSLLAAAAEAKDYLPIGRCDCILDETTEETPLHRILNSASHGTASPGALAILMESLIARHADLLAKDSEGATPLHLAAFHGQAIAVSTLCSAAARGSSRLAILNALDAEGLTPLGVALKRWQVAGARILALSGAEPPNSTRAGHCAPELLDAVLRSHAADLEVAQARSPVDCLVPPNPGRNSTLLHLAALLSEQDEEAVSCVQKLLEGGARVGRADSSGETPLMSAVRTDIVEVVRLMLAAANPGAINALNRQGQSALHVAAMEGSSKSLRLLVTEGAATDLTDVYGRTPAFYAEQRGEQEAVRFIKQGASLAAAADDTDQQGSSGPVFKSSGQWTAEDEAAADAADAAALGTELVAAGIVGGACGCVCIAFCVVLMRRRCRRRTSVAPAKLEDKKNRGPSAVNPRSTRPQPVWVKPEDSALRQQAASGRISPRPGPMSDSDASDAQGGGRGRRYPSVVVHAGPRTPKTSGGESLTIPTAFSETNASSSTRASTAESGANPQPKKAPKARSGPRAAASKGDSTAAPQTTRPKGKAKAKAKRG